MLPNDCAIDDVAIVSSKSVQVVGSFRELEPRPRGFYALAIPEEDGGYSVVAVHYDGVVSEGDTLADAMTNIAEAFRTMQLACEFKNVPFKPNLAAEADLVGKGMRVWVRVND